jgi:hypothetical protein
MASYLDFQRRALGLALRKPTPALIAQKDAMTPDWQNYDKEIRDFSIFQIEANKQFEFKRSAVQLKKDAEYALATTLHLIEAAKKRKIIDETQEKTKGLDQEMEDLQQQLQELEE